MFLISALLAAVIFVVVATSIGRLHPFAALLLAAFGFGLSTGMPSEEVVSAINRGFGDTIAYVGIIVVAGSIIGTFLHRSGGALRLAIAITNAIGRKHTTSSMGIVGYIVSMPVFCDVAYVLLSPVNRALSKRAAIPVASGAIALSLGLYATHTMVPPTPGPVAAAGILNAELGLVVLWGLVVSIVALLSGLLFATRIAGRFRLRDEIALGEEPAKAEQEVELPSLALSLLPILLPLALILLYSISQLPSSPLGKGTPKTFIGLLGQPAVALSLGAVLSIFLPQTFKREMLSEAGWIGESIRNAALIILITGAGGAFGRVLQESDIADVVSAKASALNWGILLPFVVAAAIKTAQGSSTVAIVTAAGITAPLLPVLGLDSETAKALAVVSIGAGSMVVSHANDSYFWVVTQFSGMTVRQGYLLQSLGTLIQGSTAAVAVLVFANLLL